MNRRVLLSGPVAFAILLSLSALPALAKDGADDDGGGDDHDGKDDGGHDDGGSSGSGSSGSGGPSGNGGGTDDVSKDDDERGDAGTMPLGDMLALFQKRGHATVLDVKLARSNRHLLYVIKYIDGTGTVRKSYFDARTGVLVR